MILCVPCEKLRQIASYRVDIRTDISKGFGIDFSPSNRDFNGVIVVAVPLVLRRTFGDSGL